MKRLLLIIVFSYGFVVVAQNYNCFQPGNLQYFLNGAGYLRCMRIDSVRSTGADTLFYPYHTPQTLAACS